MAASVEAVEPFFAVLWLHAAGALDTGPGEVIGGCDGVAAALYQVRLEGGGGLVDEVAQNFQLPALGLDVEDAGDGDADFASDFGRKGGEDDGGGSEVGSRAIAILESMEESFQYRLAEAQERILVESSNPPESENNKEAVASFIEEVGNRMAEQLPRTLPLARDHLKISPPVEEQEWAQLLSLVGLTQSARASMGESAEISQHPLFVIGGDRAFYIDQSTLFDALYNAFDSAARKDQSFYSGKFTSHLSGWLEEQTMNQLGRVFPTDSIYKNVVYPDPDMVGGEAELDGIILWGPFQILVEVKGRQFRLSGRLQKPSALRTDLKKNIADAFDQASRAQRYIDSNPAPEFKEKATVGLAFLQVPYSPYPTGTS